MTVYLIQLTVDGIKKYYFNQRTLVQSIALAHPFPSEELALLSFRKSKFKNLPYLFIQKEMPYWKGTKQKRAVFRSFFNLSFWIWTLIFVQKVLGLCKQRSSWIDSFHSALFEQHACSCTQNDDTFCNNQNFRWNDISQKHSKTQCQQY